MNPFITHALVLAATAHTGDGVMIAEDTGAPPVQDPPPAQDDAPPVSSAPTRDAWGRLPICVSLNAPRHTQTREIMANRAIERARNKRRTRALKRLLLRGIDRDAALFCLDMNSTDADYQRMVETYWRMYYCRMAFGVTTPVTWLPYTPNAWLNAKFVDDVFGKLLTDKEARRFMLPTLESCATANIKRIVDATFYGICATQDGHAQDRVIPVV